MITFYYFLFNCLVLVTQKKQTNYNDLVGPWIPSLNICKASILFETYLFFLNSALHLLPTTEQTLLSTYRN